MRRIAAKGPRFVLACGLVVGSGLVISDVAWSVPTATFDISSFDQFDKGTPRGTLVTSEGEVLPGLGSKRLKGFQASMVWSSTRGADGTLYIGTGDIGKVLAVRDDQVRVVANLNTVLVTALTVGPGGKLLAGTMPDARVIEVDPKTGKWRQLTKLPAEHVWALYYDRHTRRIYAASGAPGKVFSIAADSGKTEVYYDPSEKHLLFLTPDLQGHLLTGGSDRAVLYRVTGRNEARAVHDFDATELRSVAVMPDGAMYVAVNKFPVKVSGIPRLDRPVAGKEGTTFTAHAQAKDTVPFHSQELRAGAKTGQGALYRLDPEGRLDEILTLSAGYFTALAVDHDGVLWAAEGSDGKVYMVRGDRTVMTVYDLPERQVLTLSVDGKRRYLGTGDAGAVYRVLARPKAAPAYETQALDTTFGAHWGNVQVRATAELQLLSRSGNTAKPDATWGPWVPARKQPGPRAKLVSAPGRYLQVKAVWRPPYRGALRSLTAYYRPQNQQARLTEITAEQRSTGKSAVPPQRIHLTWKVANPDKDQLVYRLYLREELGVRWQPMNDGKPLDKAEFQWDTEGIPDDTYRIKVIASDERANGPATTLKYARISDPIVVDNGRPQVVSLAVRGPSVSGSVRDSYSSIASIEYALDGGFWRLVEPIDRVYDSPSEAFRIVLPANLPPGPHVLAVRVRDAVGNLGVRKIRFTR